MGYKKRSTVKVIKTMHHVRIDSKFSLTGHDFKDMFKNVPDDARLVDIDGDDDWTEYQFLEEVPDPVSTGQDYE